MATLIKPGFRLLMVDDNPDDVFLVKRALMESGVSDFFHGLSGGEEVIPYFRREAPFEDRERFPFPNALLLDLKMPGFNGFDVLKWLQDHPECKVIPTIAYSSSAVESDIHRVYALGGNAFVTKPSGLDELRTLIQITYQFWSRCQVPKAPPGERCS